MTDPTYIASLGDALAATWQKVLTHLPSVVGAALLLLVGWLVAKLLRALTERSLSRLAALAAGRRIEQEMHAAGVDRLAGKAAGVIVFWLVFVLFVAAAGEFLGLAVITTGLNRLTEYLPTILGAVLILVLGLVAGNVVRAAVTRAAARGGLAYGETLGQLVRGVILLVVAVVAIDQVGIDSQLLIVATEILIASVIGGAALAFALGSRTTVGNILALHYLAQVYKVGQRVRLDDLEGEIVELKKTGVVIDSPAGRVFVPAREFSEKRSTLVSGDGR
ncbi:MAG: mechanosensitive ion channel family protein [Thermoanaerobaculia bacterium]